MTAHRDGPLGNVKTMIKSPRLHRSLCDAAIAEADLQHLLIGEAAERNMIEQVRIEVEVPFVERLQARRTVVGDAQPLSEMGTTQLIPEGDVSLVDGRRRGLIRFLWRALHVASPKCQFVRAASRADRRISAARS